MTRVLVAALAVAALVGGCSSGGTSPFEKLRPLLEDRIFGGPVFEDEKPKVEAPPPVTREILAAVPFATIALRTATTEEPVYVVATADNGGYVTYQDRVRRSVVMRGGLLTATHGLGYNLAAVKHHQDDPLIRARPLDGWPGQIVRNYQFTRNGASDYEITVTCTYQRVAREQVEILEITFNLERVLETCSNGYRTFANTYWADPATGFVWKSEQWVGPRLPAFTVEVIRPYKT